MKSVGKHKQSDYNIQKSILLGGESERLHAAYLVLVFIIIIVYYFMVFARGKRLWEPKTASKLLRGQTIFS